MCDAEGHELHACVENSWPIQVNQVNQLDQSALRQMAFIVPCGFNWVRHWREYYHRSFSPVLGSSCAS